MPLTALYEYGQQLVARGIIPPMGWSKVSVTFALKINRDGELVEVVDLRSKAGERMTRPDFSVPYRSKHSNGLTPFFLCDNAGYLLGVDEDSVEEGETGAGPSLVSHKFLKKFNSTKELHERILSGMENPHAQSLLNFFERWDPTTCASHPVLGPVLKDTDICSVTNIVFCYDWDGTFAQDDDEIASAWQQEYIASQTEGDVVYGDCLVTGTKNVPLARLHPPVSGIAGAQSAGAYLVSFGTLVQTSNCNFGAKKQGYNAPTSMEAAALYGNALRYLFTSPKHHKMLKNGMHLLFWGVHDDDDAEASALSMATFGWRDSDYTTESDEALYHAVNAAICGTPVADELFHEAKYLNDTFYFMGIQPHAARLAITFFERSTFGAMLRNVQKHYADIAVVNDYHGGEKREDREEQPKMALERLNLYYLLSTLYDANRGAEKNNSFAPSEGLAAAMLNSILLGQPYPANMQTLTLTRIHRDLKINSARAAMLKGYLLRNSRNKEIKEVATVALNKDSNYPPYLLGQLFLVYEELQKTALNNRTINNGIKEMYFAGAATNPRLTFSTLSMKAEKHLNKLMKMQRRGEDGVYYTRYARRIQEIMNKLELPLPSVLTPDEQSAFALGYYHAREDWFTKQPKADATPAIPKT